jgi:HSP20 family protein
MEEFRREMERLNERAAGVSHSREGTEIAFAPQVDVYDAGEAFIVKADLPGVRGQDLEIRLEGTVLSIRGQRTANEAGGESYLCCERPTGRFVRAIELPSRVEPDSITATFLRGVLEITLPKTAATGAKRIPVDPGEEGEETVSPGTG